MLIEDCAIASLIVRTDGELLVRHECLTKRSDCTCCAVADVHALAFDLNFNPLIPFWRNHRLQTLANS